ncbi:MAG TPA: glycosyltransferase family 1 protein, partial [Thermoanaerobaculia bacterium]|nr:glycosyltransferase family 1 protein [Thermoanaerobaculia bacterium]
RRTIARITRRPAKLRIGVDIRSFYEPLTGIGWYLYHLLHEIAKSDDVELYLFGDARVTDIGPTLHAEVPASAHLCWFDARGRGRIARVDRALTAAAYVLWMWIVDVDVMFAPNYFLPRLLAAVARRRVITIHDLTYKRFPELLQKETLDNLERHMAHEIAVADTIICVSESTRQDLLRHYQVDAQRAITIHSGVDVTTGDPARDVASEVARLHKYILFVSTIEPRKNLDVLLDAFDKLQSRGAYDGSLVIAGRIGWKAEKLVARLRRPGVVHLDYVHASSLAAVYKAADMFVFPSIYEGFGFPLLEAMSLGVPAIAARSSSLPEIGGNGALYFDPRSADDLAQVIERVAHDANLRRQLIERGLAQAARFRWSDAAAKTLTVLRAAAA